MLHSPGRKSQEKAGKDRAKFSAVCDSIRGKWKAMGLEASCVSPETLTSHPPTHTVPNEQLGLQVYHN